MPILGLSIVAYNYVTLDCTAIDLIDFVQYFVQ